MSQAVQYHREIKSFAHMQSKLQKPTTINILVGGVEAQHQQILPSSNESKYEISFIEKKDNWLSNLLFDDNFPVLFNEKRPDLFIAFFELDDFFADLNLTEILKPNCNEIDKKFFNSNFELVQYTYKYRCLNFFETIIRRKSDIAILCHYQFDEKMELNQLVQNYMDLHKEDFAELGILSYKKQEAIITMLIKAFENLLKDVVSMYPNHMSYVNETNEDYLKEYHS